MNRRDFLKGSTGLVSLGVPTALCAQARPCAPSTVKVSGGNEVQSLCAKPTSAPEWFRNLESLRWVEVAGGNSMPNAWQRGNVLVDVLHPRDYWSPAFEERTGSAVGYGNYPNAVFVSWNGATVDQQRGELLVVGNGGHMNGPDNGAYALALRADQPVWQRIADATPGSHVVGVGDIDQHAKPALYLDGRPAAMHTAGIPVWANGRVWFPFQNSYFSVGKSSFATFSFDRELLEATPGLRAWTSKSTLPWRYHGQSEETGAIGNFTFGRGLYDRRGERVYYFGKSGSSYWFMDVNPASAAFGRITRVRPGGVNYSCSWAAAVHGLDRNLIVLGRAGSQQIHVLDADRPSDSASWVVRQTTPDLVWDTHDDAVPSGYALEYGAVYHAPSRSILLYNPNRMAVDRLRRLSVPCRVDGSYDPAGPWIWSEIQMSADGGRFPEPLSRGSPSSGGVYGRFNIVEDMDGNGTAALVAATQVTGPAYVCKLGGVLA